MKPRARDIHPGSFVNIILKEDQPTGKLTAGVVRNLLTRGDHPRGVKVCLVNGLVGRVQSFHMATMLRPREDSGGSSGGGAARGEGGGGGEGEKEKEKEKSTGTGTGTGASTGATAGEVGVAQAGLDAFIVPSRNRGRKSKRGAAAGGAGAGQRGMVECPVCGEFKGDEPAVAYHVGTHFIR